MVSWCTNTGTSTSTNPKTDIETSRDINGKWNGPAGKWLVNSFENYSI